MKIKIIKLSGAVLMSLAAGAIGSAFTVTGINSWYQYLVKPSFNPPNWVFGPVWTTLYILMGISLYLIWKDGLKKDFVKNSFLLFILNLVLNSFWSIAFFGMQNPALAFIVIILLWLVILGLIIRFYKINKLASYLLIPYILWVSFASVLNFSIWQLNSGVQNNVNNFELSEDNNLTDKTIDCLPTQRNVDACVGIYKPVCANVRVECITTPCPPIKETFGNSCVACTNERVISYTEGECGE